MDTHLTLPLAELPTPPASASSFWELSLLASHTFNSSSPSTAPARRPLFSPSQQPGPSSRASALARFTDERPRWARHSPQPSHAAWRCPVTAAQRPGCNLRGARAPLGHLARHSASTEPSQPSRALSTSRLEAWAASFPPQPRSQCRVPTFLEQKSKHSLGTPDVPGTILAPHVA